MNCSASYRRLEDLPKRGCFHPVKCFHLKMSRALRMPETLGQFIVIPGGVLKYVRTMNVCIERFRKRAAILECYLRCTPA